jgi:DMSO/TMAO reductase YedYZ molybdopterin-dependent catalytic subunit
MNISRRHFFGLTAGVLLPPAGDRISPDMLLRAARLQDYEMPLTGFSDYITPVERFFVRTHTYIPRVDVNAWRLTVTGKVSSALTLTLDDLRRLPAVDVVGVLECAGNGRGLYEPSMPGLQWGNGAVGNARWRGVRLADVLKRAGVTASAIEVLFEGADVPLGTMPDFQRSIPIAKALDPRTLLAYEMNGEPLPVKHGFPLRLVAPGWAGDSWVKWLTAISVLDQEHAGFWMARAYRHPGRPVSPGVGIPPEQMQPVTSLRVKSVIAAPLDGSQAAVGTLLIVRGSAWSGDAGPVTAVDVSVDGGRRWAPATLQPNQRTEFGWRQWEYRWTPAREAYVTILARARDAAGNTQPLDQEWNPSGYLWNVVPRARVDVVSQLSAATAAAHAPAAAPGGEPPAAFKNACLTCHDDDVVRQQRLTRAQWEAEMNKMVGWGARVSDADRRELLDYLFSTYGPRPR